MSLKADIKRVLIELDQSSFSYGLGGSSENRYLTPYLERIMKLIEEADSE